MKFVYGMVAVLGLALGCASTPEVSETPKALSVDRTLYILGKIIEIYYPNPDDLTEKRLVIRLLEKQDVTVTVKTKDDLRIGGLAKIPTRLIKEEKKEETPRDRSRDVSEEF